MSAKRTQGLLITFEGGEGTGKSTQVKLLTRRLLKGRYSVVTAREPGGTDLGNQVRDLILQQAESPLAELFLFEAARAELITRLVVPNLANGAIVILDRFTDSTLAYQGYGRGLDLEEVVRVNTIATCGIMPDLTILLDLDVGSGLFRKIGETGQDAIGREDREFHERVHDGYLAMAAAGPERWVVLDATLPQQQLAEQVWAVVSSRLAALNS